jgi:hypothetical protein
VKQATRLGMMGRDTTGHEVSRGEPYADQGPPYIYKCSNKNKV